jgi:ubiquinone biosynthesis protein
LSIQPKGDPAVGVSDIGPPPVAEAHRGRLLFTVARDIVADKASSAPSEARPPGPEVEDDKGLRRARAVRSSLERLGPFYVKIGQILSTRPDLVSDVMIAELEHLHDDVSATPFGAFAAILEQEMPGWRRRFRSIDVVRPLGSASLAQVYRATMHDGTPAVVKIQRPGIRAQVLRDMRNMRRVARLVGKLAPKFNELIDVDSMLRVIFNGMEPELDFTLEAQNMVDARKAVKQFKHLTVPKVIDATPRVLVQTLAPGVSIGDADPGAFTGKERRKICRDLLTFMYRGYFSEHVFHADPHPGNIFVHPGRKANVIDWGMVGRIDRHLGRLMVLVLLSVAQNDAPATARGWVEMGRATSRADVPGFAGDMSLLVPRIHSASLEELNFGVTLSSILMYATRRGIHTSPHVSLLGKSFANVEGSVRNLAPELSIVDVFADAMEGILADLFTDVMSKKQAARFAMDLLIGSTTALDHSRNILQDLRDHEFMFKLEMQDGEKASKALGSSGLLHVGLGVLIAWMWGRRSRK